MQMTIIRYGMLNTVDLISLLWFCNSREICFFQKTLIPLFYKISLK